MRWLLKALSSSLGKKYVIATTGLLLCGFLVVHLAGNLLLIAGPGFYNEYAHRLHENEFLLKIAEAGLLALFLVHTVLAFVATWNNNRARKTPYERKETKLRGQILTFTPSNWMLVTGLVVLGFLILHLVDFTFEARPDLDLEGLEPYDKALVILRNPLSWVVYIVGSLVLGVHLSHGFWSAFQSLGWQHPKYSSITKVVGILFAVVIALGFAILPIWAWAYVS